MLVLTAGGEAALYVGNKTITGTLTVTGQTLIADGASVSAPGMAFAAAPSTGLFRPATNRLSVVVGGFETARFVAGTELTCATGATIGWGASIAASDTTLRRLAAGSLARTEAIPGNANYGALSIGSGPFDGASAGFFTGSSSGTGLAVNAASGFVGDLLNLQTAGAPMLTVTAGGIGQLYGASFTIGASATRLMVMNVNGILLRSGMGYTWSANSGDSAGAPDLSLRRLAAGALARTEAIPGNANYGALSIGNGAWDGATAGFFVGSSSGTGIAVNAASGFGGNLIALQVAGSSKFSVDASGNISCGNVVGNRIQTGADVLIANLQPLNWNMGSSPALYAEAASTLAQRNSTNSQTFNLYDTFTDTSNYRRASFSWSGGDFTIGMTALGTGAAGLGNMLLLPGSGKALRLGAAGASKWNIATTGDISSFQNSGFAHGTSALATNATAGFFMVNSCAGTPTGVPASIPTGQIPLVWDSTNLKLYAYTGGAWKGSAAFT